MARILVIDDDGPVLRVMREVLALDGHTVVTAENGLQAMAVWKPGEIDLVVTDILMPERDGLETIRALRKADPTVPIVATSGGGFEGLDLLHVAHVLGATRQLAKPFGAKELLKVVREALEERAKGS